MAEKTKIEWCDHTFNPFRGCSKVHAGCTNCYAERQSKRNPGLLGIWGEAGTRVVADGTMWAMPRKWNAAAEQSGERRRVFCASLADVFEDWAGPLTNANGHVLFPGNCLTNPWRDSGNPETEKPLTLNDVRRRLFALIDETPWLDWLLLTKRPENVRNFWWQRSDVTYVPEAGRLNDYPQNRRENVWIGTSVSDQETADKYVPELLKLRDLTPCLFLSMEPLLGPVSFRWASWKPLSQMEQTDHLDGLRMLDWVIVGGESGPKARPCDVAWVRSVVQQCQSASVPVFIKQLGAIPRGREMLMTPQEWRLRDQKGGDPEEWPEDLRVREFPALIGGAE